MIPGWLISILAHIPTIVLVLGSICLLLLLAIGASVATHFLLIRMPFLLAHWREREWKP